MTSSEQKFPFVPDVPFEEYSELFKDFFMMKREDGILELKMHYQSGAAKWAYGLHKGLGQIMKYIGLDLENQVLIITGAGDNWIGGVDAEYMAYLQKLFQEDQGAYAKNTYNHWYMDGKQLLKNLLWDVEIPTIGAINGHGPTAHTEFALACDITLALPETEFGDSHYAIAGLVPGDGQFITLQHYLGDKRANLLGYTTKSIPARQAVDLGLISEVVEESNLLPRAWELAREIMKKDYYTRRLTHLIMTQPLRRRLLDDFDLQFAAEGWSGSMNPPGSLPDSHNYKK